MSSTINAATSGGLISTGDTSGQLQLQTAGTTALTVTSGQLVGVGTSSPSSALDVASSNSGITLTNTAVSNKQWRLGGNSSGYFQITETGVADRLLIDTSGNLKLITGGAKILNSSGNPILQQTGSVLQVINSTYTTEVSTTSSTYVTTGITATITPISSTSKIAIIASTVGYTATLSGLLFYTLCKNGSNLVGSNGFSLFYEGSSNDGGFPVTMSYLDSPNTTSATTYAIYQKSNGTTSIKSSWYGTTSSITLMEIAA